MKKIVLMLLALAITLACVPGLADISDIMRFQPYTNVNLEVFTKAGYYCYYDDFKFMAEIAPSGRISDKDEYDTYTISADIKMLYSAGECILIPRLIFKRNGMFTYYDDRMEDVYIKNGENRYIIDVSGCARSTNSKSSTATDSSVEPIYDIGYFMLQDIAENAQTVTVRFGVYEEFVLTTANIDFLKNFYNTCKEAGVFSQKASAYSDDYAIRTLFNENSAGGQESAVEEPAAE